VDRIAAFKNCCMQAGIFDGELRNYFFPGVIAQDGSAAVLHLAWACTNGVP
jgi:hypothetical protein